MAVCKCGKAMQPKGEKMVCSCGYSYEIPKKLPSYEELLAERNMLLAETKKLKEIIEQINRKMRS